MKQLFLILLILSLGISGCQNKQKKKEEKITQETVTKPIETKSGDFRSAKWGMSKEQVKKLESLPSIGENKNLLGYKGKIANLDCQIAFQFINDTLYSAAYVITENHINNNDYISDFKKLKELLTEKYGQPKLDKMIWKGSLYKGDESRYGMAVVTGNLVYVADWKTETTDIRLILSGDNFTPSLAAAYESQQYKSLVEKKEKEEILNDL